MRRVPGFLLVVFRGSEEKGAELRCMRCQKEWSMGLKDAVQGWRNCFSLSAFHLGLETSR